jgi:hypothetical protein
LGKKRRKRLINARFALCEAVKLALNPLVRFCVFSRLLENERLGGMKGCEIGTAPGVIAKTKA